MLLAPNSIEPSSHGKSMEETWVVLLSARSPCDGPRPAQSRPTARRPGEAGALETGKGPVTGTAGRARPCQALNTGGGIAWGVSQFLF